MISGIASIGSCLREKVPQPINANTNSPTINLFFIEKKELNIKKLMFLKNLSNQKNERIPKTKTSNNFIELFDKEERVR